LMPVQGGGSVAPRDYRPIINLPRSSVPESVARLAFETYEKRYGSDQSFERLHQRGGFGWHELIAGLRGDMSSEGFTKVKEDLERVFQPAREEGGESA